MAIWLPLSAAYLVFLAGIIVKAVRHFRLLRSAQAYAPAVPGANANAAPGPSAASLSRDWSPAR